MIFRVTINMYHIPWYSIIWGWWLGIEDDIHNGVKFAAAPITTSLRDIDLKVSCLNRFLLNYLYTCVHGGVLHTYENIEY